MTICLLTYVCVKQIIDYTFSMTLYYGSKNLHLEMSSIIVPEIDKI